MDISAQEVVKLRQRTGAGVMDCKSVLRESGGDVQKAIELLRKRGQKLSQARSGRETKQGRVLLRRSKDNKVGMLLALSCETDFVAKNDDFNRVAEAIADVAFSKSPTDISALLQLKHEELSLTEHIDDLVAKIGEKVNISHYKSLEGEHVVGYLHAGEKLGVLVALQNADPDACEVAGKNVALQVAAMNPLALDKDSITGEAIQKELEIAKEIARKEGKPENLLEKIAQGRLQKFFKEQTLLAQPFVKDSALSVAKYLETVSKGLRIASFLRVATAD